MPKVYRPFLFLLLLLSLFLYFLLLSFTKKSLSRGKILHSSRKFHYILQWNEASPSFDLSRQSFDSCVYSNCHVTSDRRALNSLDEFAAIVVNADDPDTVDVLPNRQLRIFSATKPVLLGESHRLFSINFSMTISPRHDSTIVLNQIQTITVNKEGTDKRDINSEKLGLVAFWSQDCDTKAPSRRLAERLQEHIALEWVRDCGHSESQTLCSGPEMDDELMLCLNNNYKFLLAPEDVHCPDLVSNPALLKLLGTDHATPMVPVVWGGADFNALLPSHSFLDVNKYESLEQLANHLKLIDAEDKRLLEFLHWRQNTRIDVNMASQIACQLCYRLNNNANTDILDVKHWWLTNNECRDGEMILSKFMRRW